MCVGGFKIALIILNSVLKKAENFQLALKSEKSVLKAVQEQAWEKNNYKCWMPNLSLQ